MKELTSGRFYALSVRTSGGELWYADGEPFTLQDPPQKRFLQLTSERIQGLLTLGKQPRSATITFGAERGSESTVVMSNDKGIFRGILPGSGTWKVLVDSQSPPVRRTLDVTVDRTLSDSGNNVEIHLPSDALEGEIVDKDGNVVSNALLRIHKRFSRELISKNLEVGTFRLEGLADGEYDVDAEAQRMDSSNYTVTISEHEVDPSFLRITVNPRRALRGRVTTPSGDGAVGATVQRLSPGGIPAMLGPPTPVDADGKFTAYVSEELKEICLTVFAPGFAKRVVRLTVQDDEQLVPVDQSGGTLIIDQPADPNAFVSRRPVVYKSGCVLFPGLLKEKWDKGKDRTLITGVGVERGGYSVCMLSYQEMAGYMGGKPVFPSCVHGTLQSRGTLALKVQP